jgi:hypothetical protein
MIKQGQILKTKNGGEIKVLGVCGEVYFMSITDDFKKASACSYTIEEIKESFIIPKETWETKKCIPMDIILLSNPPQNRCKNCGQCWYTSHETPNCLFQTPKTNKVEEQVKNWYGEWLNGDFDFDFNEFLSNKVKQIIKDERNRMPTQDKYLKWFKGFGLEMASLGIKMPQDLSDLDAVVKGIKDKIAESYDTGFDDSIETS